MKWTIRLKFLFVMSGLLTMCLGMYLFMAITTLKSDKTKLVFDLNRSQVSNLASELETGLSGVSEKLKLFTQLPQEAQKKMAEDILSNDSDVIAVSLYRSINKKSQRNYVQERYLETYGMNKKEFFKDTDKDPIPFDQIQKKGEDIWNASIDNFPPMLGFGRLVLLLDGKGVPIDQWIVVGYVKLDRFLKSVSLVSLSDITISNRRGEVLVQRDALSLYQKPSIKNSRLFNEALKAKTRLSVRSIQINNKKWLSAYTKAFHGNLVVISKAPESEVFKVVKELSARTILFGSIILTLVILAAFLISRSLTHNIALLVKRMTEVSRGDLTTTIHLKGRDETVLLGSSFNQMINDLRQSRDELEIMNKELDQKVKNRTRELEIQNRKVQEAQEVLIRTTRLASMGEIAGRTAHEVLNPLTSLLTRAGVMQKRMDDKYNEPMELLDEMSKAWQEDVQKGGFDNLVKCWSEPSQLDPNKSLFDEDMENIHIIKQSVVEQTQEFTKDLQFIKAEGDRIGKIIHGMRRLGNMEANAQLQSFHNILTDSTYIMADLYEQKRFRIEKDLSAGMDLVTVDRDEMIQAITNLMRNSLQSLEESAESVEDRKNLYIKLSTSNKDGNFILDIEDNGIGISQDNQVSLFERKFTTKSPEEGTGLGLSISRRFLRGYNGDIELVQSVSKLKTIFRITLPLKQNEEQRKASA